jgi:hypothetical protein
MKTYVSSACIDPRILDLGTNWRWMVSFTPRSLEPRRKSHRYPLDRRLGGPQNRSGRRGEERNRAPIWTQTPTPRPSSPNGHRYRIYSHKPETVLHVDYITEKVGSSGKSWVSLLICIWEGLVSTPDHSELSVSWFPQSYMRVPK